MCRWLMYGDNCKLTHWAYWSYYMQFPLENRENKKTHEMSEPNSRKYLLAKISTYTVFEIRDWHSNIRCAALLCSLQNWSHQKFAWWKINWRMALPDTIYPMYSHTYQYISIWEHTQYCVNANNTDNTLYCSTTGIF